MDSGALECDYIATEAPEARILTGLIRADIFEQVIQQRYLGTKRFSLEGLTVADSISRSDVHHRSENGVKRALLFAMAHRGRLNVMVNTVGRDSLRKSSPSSKT